MRVRSVTNVRAPRRGISLAEVIVATAILAIVGSIVISTGFVVSTSDRDRYATVADTLGRLAQTIAGNDPTNDQASFKWVIQRYPWKLSQLTSPITTSQTDICGVPYTATHTARW